jgi:hypothetical protein
MRIRQIVFAAQHLQPARELLAQLFELPAPYRDPGVAEFGLDNAVFCLGDQFVEVISPSRPDTACGRHLARHGDSGYMLILQTDSLAREQARFASLGVRSVWQADYPEISATHLHPKDVGAAIVSVDEPRPAAAWRWGGPDWQVAPGDAGRQRVLGIHLLATDPQALAHRWAQVLGCPAPLAHGAGWRVALHKGFVEVQATADGADRVAGFSLAVADPAALLARAQALGLPVQGQSTTVLGAQIHLQPLAVTTA